MLLLFWNGAQTSPPSLSIVTGNPIGLLLALTYAPEGVDIQYTEVMEFAVCIATSAGFSVVLPNDASVGVVSTDIVVSGAGSSVVNGTYAYAGIEDSKPAYETGDNVIRWYEAAAWQISSSGYGMYYSVDDVATPDLVATWIAFYGVLPLPTVTAGTTPTLTEVAIFTLEMPQIIEMEVYEELSL